VDGKPDLSVIWHCELMEVSAGYLFNVAKDLRPEKFFPGGRFV
jgi:hypothetical protein